MCSPRASGRLIAPWVDRRHFPHEIGSTLRRPGSARELIAGCGLQGVVRGQQIRA
jgi:hypothetical protein